VKSVKFVDLQKNPDGNFVCYILEHTISSVVIQSFGFQCCNTIRCLRGNVRLSNKALHISEVSEFIKGQLRYGSSLALTVGTNENEQEQ
jgi:hypothetical protein